MFRNHFHFVDILNYGSVPQGIFILYSFINTYVVMILCTVLIIFHCFFQFAGWTVALNKSFFLCMHRPEVSYLFCITGRRIIYALKEFKVDKIAVSILRLKIGVLNKCSV
jgi:hypothetical protein